MANHFITTTNQYMQQQEPPSFSTIPNPNPNPKMDILSSCFHQYHEFNSHHHYHDLQEDHLETMMMNLSSSSNLMNIHQSLMMMGIFSNSQDSCLPSVITPHHDQFHAPPPPPPPLDNFPCSPIFLSDDHDHDHHIQKNSSASASASASAGDEPSIVSSNNNNQNEKKRKTLNHDCDYYDTSATAAAAAGAGAEESSSANSTPSPPPPLLSADSSSSSRCRTRNYSTIGKKKVKCKEKEEEKAKKEVVHVRARRGQATDSHSLAERVRRGKINERLKCLQDIVPGCHKTMGMAVMLDEIINYVQSLQSQVEFLSMKLTAASTFYNFNAETDTMDFMQRAKAYEAVKMQKKLLREGNDGIEIGHHLDLTFGCHPSLLPYNK